jgi:hypothetical protein
LLIERAKKPQQWQQRPNPTGSSNRKLSEVCELGLWRLRNYGDSALNCNTSKSSQAQAVRQLSALVTVIP